MRSIKSAGRTRRLGALALLCVGLHLGGARADATLTVINGNAPGVGFNDPTPMAPAGGNTGTTLGQQRLIAFTYAASIWGARLTSAVPVRVLATFEPLSCSETSAVLGAAGAWDIFADFPGAPRANTWYPAALAGKLFGGDQSAPADPHIVAYFNSRLGLAPDCLPGSGFYLGLDNNHGGAIDLVTVLLHELAHGLGFQNFTDEESGEFYGGIPSIWDYFLLDNRLEQQWVNLSALQRAASSVSGDGLSWSGPQVTAAVPQVLDPVSRLTIGGPRAGAAAGNYEVGDASFGPSLSTPAVSGQMMPVLDQANGGGLACDRLDALNTLAVRGNIALVDRGVCNFVIKAKNVQDAGAIGMIVVDNAPGPVIGLGGSDPAIVIPAVRVSQGDGAIIRAALRQRSRNASGVIAALGVDSTRLAGTDRRNRILMYTPLDYQPGSSVSHYTTAAKPNQLMEPAINGDLTHAVEPPRDLTLPLLRDIGW